MFETSMYSSNLCIMYLYELEICAWNLKHPFVSACFNWMIPNLYMGNGCLVTKHPFKKKRLFGVPGVYTYCISDVSQILTFGNP